MQECAREQIFEPYFASNAQSTSTRKSTGMGLAVSRSIVRDHGGSFTLESIPVLGGASFRLSLPVSGVGEVKTPFDKGTKINLPRLQRVLVVDDEADLAEVIRKMLEFAGYEVSTAESGAKALELLAAAPFDAIVSDLRMPDMDGAGLWREIVVQHPRLSHRILFVTGDILSPAASEFLRDTRCAALEKPFLMSDLRARVAAMLNIAPTSVEHNQYAKVEKNKD